MTARADTRNGTYMETKKLIEKAVQKDPDAFCSLLQMHAQDMYRVALAILMNDEDVADALQDVALTCWEKITTLRNPEFFKTWLIRIVINKSREILRRNRRYADIEDVPETVIYDECNIELKEALRSLEEKYRVPVILYYYEGYDTGEISKILKLPGSTVRTRLQRAREKLKEFLEGPKVQTGGHASDHSDRQDKRGEYNADTRRYIQTGN